MDSNPEVYIERMLEISEKKRTLLESMLSLTLSQAKVITEEGIQDLKVLVNAKQEKINEIDRIDENFDVYFRRLKQILKVKSLDEMNGAGIKGIKQLQECIKKIMAIMKDISTIESENNLKTQNLLNKLGTGINTINHGKKAAIAYTPGYNYQTKSHYFDKKK